MRPFLMLLRQTSTYRFAHCISHNMEAQTNMENKMKIKAQSLKPDLLILEYVCKVCMSTILNRSHRFPVESKFYWRSITFYIERLEITSENLPF